MAERDEESADRRQTARDAAGLSGVAVLVASAFVLGLVGFTRTQPLDDAVYSTLQLFTIDTPDGPGNGWIDVARFLAAAAAFWALLLLAAELLSERIQAVRLRYRVSGQVVVVGLGGLGHALARSLRQQGKVVVGIDRDVEGSPNARSLRAAGVLLVEGDGRDAVTVRRAGLHRASAAAVMCGDDAVNVEVLGALAAVERSSVLPVLVHVETPELWLALDGELLDQGRRPSVRATVFTLPDAAARNLASRYADRLGEGPVLLLGDSVFVRQVAAHIARGARDARPVIHWAGEHATRSVAALSSSPEVSDRATLVAHEVAVDGVDVRGLAATLGARPALTVVHGSDEPTSIAAGLALSRLLPGDGDVLVAVRDHSAGAAKLLAGQAGCRAFGLVSETLTARLMELDTIELLARATHERYRQMARAGAGSADADVPWHELPPSLRRSSRRFAEGIERKLADLGWLVAASATASADELILEEADVERLAVAEHERWCDDLRADGWRHGPVRDPHARVHPQLIEWSELSDAEREKDRELVRALPSLLAAAGLRAQRAPQSRATSRAT